MKEIETQPYTGFGELEKIEIEQVVLDEHKELQAFGFFTFNCLS